MKRIFLYIFLLVALMACLNACNKSATIQTDQLADYMQLQVGKYITYRLDSLVWINFGTQDTIFSYLARDVIDDSITDNLGRPSWRVVRYISDTSGIAPWTPIETYMITPTPQATEVVENNLRFIKLVLPVVTGYNWMGNSYIDTRSAFSDLTWMDGWNYVYDSVGMPYNLPTQVVPNSIIIRQDNDSSGAVADSVFSTRTFSEEVYGKGIGLIYKNLLHWEYQPPNINVPVGSTTGFGITLTMVDHN